MSETREPPTAPANRASPLAAVAVALAVHLWLFAHTPATARDTTVFARTALQLEAALPGGPVAICSALQRAEHPPGYPVAVLIASVPVRAFVTAPLPDQMILSARVTSLAVAVLLAFVHFRLGRELFGPAVGFMGAALFQILPVAARVTSDGLNDGLYLLLLGIALLLGAWAVRGGGRLAFAGSGIAAGAAYLVRPEGLLAAGAVGVVVAGLVVARRWPARVAAVRLAALVCGALLLAGPYMAAVGGLTNKPTGKRFFQRVLGEPAAVPKPAVAAPLLAGWYPSHAEGHRAAWLASTFGDELLKAFHYTPAALAVLGFLIVWRRAAGPDPALLVPAAFAALNLLTLLGLAAGSGYLSERHALPVVFVGCVFAAASVVPVSHWFAARPGIRRLLNQPAAAVVGPITIALTCLPFVFRPLHENRAGHVAAGRWLAEHAEPRDAIVDPYDWAQFHAGRSLYRIPPVADHPAVMYVVLEAGKADAPHSPLWYYRSAVELSRSGLVVYQWPARGPARVVVYKVVFEER